MLSTIMQDMEMWYGLFINAKCGGVMRPVYR